MWKDACVGENLSAAEKDAVFQLLARRWRCFPPADGNLGSTEMTEQIAEMLKQGIIRHSFCPWAAPVVIVRKKSGNYRFFVEYRRLNAVTKSDPLPRMDDVFDRIAGTKNFSSLD
jgi:hypothetical protein